MGKLILTFFSLLIVVAVPSAAEPLKFKKSVAQKPRRHKATYQVTAAESKYMQNLLRRCEDGNGQSCDSYGRTLVQLDRPGDRRLAIQYIRRACVLAYTPACNRRSPSERAAFASEHCGPHSGKLITLTAKQQVTRVAKGSILDRAGLRPGDVITKVNGVRVATAGEVGNALDSGKALLEVNRAGAVVPLAIYCP